MPSQYRYALQPYAGPASRYTCPNCGKPRKLTRYLDTHTGELLEPRFGKCDRADNCGYHLSPYHLDIGKGELSYKEQRFLQSNSAISLNAASHTSSIKGHRSEHLTPAKSTESISIPMDLLKSTCTAYSENKLAQLLWKHFGVKEGNQLLARFNVGTSSHWPGACVFWLIDELECVRGGQVVLFDDAGHTVKITVPGKPAFRHTTWVHTALLLSYRKRASSPLPGWKLIAHQARRKALVYLAYPNSKQCHRTIRWP